MSAISDFFLNSKASVVQLELLEISHSQFSQIFYAVRNATRGITVTHENGLDYAYEYVPMKITPGGVREDLDFLIEVTFGDLGEIIPAEIDAIRAANAFSEYPVIRYRVYRSDDLTFPLYGPYKLEIEDFNFTREGSSFEAKPPSLNTQKTGETYKLARFPMLRGLL